MYREVCYFSVKQMQSALQLGRLLKVKVSSLYLEKFLLEQADRSTRRESG